jgi:hypothetical protein
VIVHILYPALAINPPYPKDLRTTSIPIQVYRVLFLLGGIDDYNRKEYDRRYHRNYDSVLGILLPRLYRLAALEIHTAVAAVLYYHPFKIG